MWSQRLSVDDALQRRHARRRSVRTVPTSDVCDADPIVSGAALHHGERTATRCPVGTCSAPVTRHRVLGDQVGGYSGRVRSPAELDEMQSQSGAFTVCAVEVCTGWNHMIESYLPSDGVARPARREQTVEDIHA